MLACLCGGIFDLFLFVGFASIVGGLWGKLMNRKCCNHKCEVKNEQSN